MSSLSNPKPNPDPAFANPKPKIWAYVVINQLAFPGVGTVLGGHRIGYVQAAIMVAGAIPTLGFLSWLIVCSIQVLSSGATDPAEFTARYQPYTWIGWTGAALCLIAWCWSLYSSIQMLKTPPAPPPIPGHQ